jgi:ribonuclease-3
MTKDFSQFEQKIGIIFKDKSLLRQAFTHSSYLNENKSPDLADNERLEFLGDAVLELIVTEYLFTLYPEKPEGELTAYRSALVNAQTLSMIAADMGMNDFMLLSRGEARDAGRARAIILANAIEALVGALYLDSGYEAAKKFVAAVVFPRIETPTVKEMLLDAKSKFQEAAQDHTGVTPLYKTTKETGPDHARIFTVGVYLGKELVATGEGASKQEAEQAAARKGLADKGWG